MTEIMRTVSTALRPLLDFYQVTLDLPLSWPTALGQDIEITWLWKLYLYCSIRASSPGTHLVLGSKMETSTRVIFWVHNPGVTTLFAEREVEWLLLKDCATQLDGEVKMSNCPAGGHQFALTLPAYSS